MLFLAPVQSHDVFVFWIFAHTRALVVSTVGARLATAQLSPEAKTQLIGQTFGSDREITFSAADIMFKLNSAASGGIPTSSNGTVTLRAQATSGAGDIATLDYGSVQVLTRYEGTNRYGQRDIDHGGDDWAQPFVIKLLEHFAGEITVGDIAQMNGGVFQPHQTHGDGWNLDAHYDGYNARDAASAAEMIHLLNDDLYGSHIQKVFVTYSATPGNAFYDAIDDVTLDDGRSALSVIRPVSGHDTHFHWVVV